MEGKMSSYFSFDVFVHAVFFPPSLSTTSIPQKPAVAFRLLDFPTVVLYPDDNVRADQATQSGVSFQKGKSCLIKLDAETLLASKTPIVVFLMWLDVLLPEKAKLIGTVSVDISSVLSSVAVNSSSSSCSRQGKFVFQDLVGNKMAGIDCTISLSLVHPSLIPHILNASNTRPEQASFPTLIEPQQTEAKVLNQANQANQPPSSAHKAVSFEPSIHIAAPTHIEASAAVHPQQNTYQQQQQQTQTQRSNTSVNHNELLRTVAAPSAVPLIISDSTSSVAAKPPPIEPVNREPFQPALPTLLCRDAYCPPVMFFAKPRQAESTESNVSQAVSGTIAYPASPVLETVSLPSASTRSLVIQEKMALDNPDTVKPIQMSVQQPAPPTVPQQAAHNVTLPETATSRESESRLKGGSTVDSSMIQPKVGLSPRRDEGTQVDLAPASQIYSSIQPVSILQQLALELLQLGSSIGPTGTLQQLINGQKASTAISTASSPFSQTVPVKTASRTRSIQHRTVNTVTDKENGGVLLSPMRTPSKISASASHQQQLHQQQLYQQQQHQQQQHQQQSSYRGVGSKGVTSSPSPSASDSVSSSQSSSLSVSKSRSRSQLSEKPLKNKNKATVKKAHPHDPAAVYKDMPKTAGNLRKRETVYGWTGTVPPGPAWWKDPRYNKKTVKAKSAKAGSRIKSPNQQSPSEDVTLESASDSSRHSIQSVPSDVHSDDQPLGSPASTVSDLSTQNERKNKHAALDLTLNSSKDSMVSFNTQSSPVDVVVPTPTPHFRVASESTRNVSIVDSVMQSVGSKPQQQPTVKQPLTSSSPSSLVASLLSPVSSNNTQRERTFVTPSSSSRGPLSPDPSIVRADASKVVSATKSDFYSDDFEEDTSVTTVGNTSAPLQSPKDVRSTVSKTVRCFMCGGAIAREDAEIHLNECPNSVVAVAQTVVSQPLQPHESMDSSIVSSSKQPLISDSRTSTTAAQVVGADLNQEEEEDEPIKVSPRLDPSAMGERARSLMSILSRRPSKSDLTKDTEGDTTETTSTAVGTSTSIPRTLTVTTTATAATTALTSMSSTAHKGIDTEGEREEVVSSVEIGRSSSRAGGGKMSDHQSNLHESMSVSQTSVSGYFDDFESETSLIGSPTSLAISSSNRHFKV